MTTSTDQMNDKVKEMILEWVQKDGGDVERTARWMAYKIRIGTVKECRALIAEAQN